MSVAWRSIDESPIKRPKRARLLAPPPPPVDFSMKAMETSAIFLGSLLLHAVLAFIIVMCYWEVTVEPEQAYAVTIWRDAKGKDVLRIGAPEEGPVTKGPEEKQPEPPKKEEPPPPEPPKVEEPVKPPPPKETVQVPEVPVVLPPIVKGPDVVPPPAKEAPEGGVPDPQPAAPAVGVGATAGDAKSDTPGVGKPSDGMTVTESDIDKDPTAAIRRRRSGTLTALREGSQRDIVVVTGQYDHIQDVMDRLEIPYMTIDPEQLPKRDLSKSKVVLINCHSAYVQSLFRLANVASIEKEIAALDERETGLRARLKENAKDKRKTFETGLELLKVTSQLSDLHNQLAAVSGANELVDKIKAFVDGGGYVFSSDWGISILERAFPGTIKNGGMIGPRTVSMRPRPGVKSPLLDDVFYTGPKTGTVVLKKLLWEVDSGSYAIKVEKPEVQILAEAPELSRNSAIAVAFASGNGKVLHVLSHFDRQATKQGDYALQNLLLNFLMERVKK